MAALEAFILAAQQPAAASTDQRAAILRPVDIESVLRRLRDQREEQDLILLGIL